MSGVRSLAVILTEGLEWPIMYVCVNMLLHRLPNRKKTIKNGTKNQKIDIKRLERFYMKWRSKTTEVSNMQKYLQNEWKLDKFNKSFKALSSITHWTKKFFHKKVFQKEHPHGIKIYQEINYCGITTRVSSCITYIIGHYNPSVRITA